jgi:hypothetical protein
MHEISVARLKLSSAFKYGYAAMLALFLPIMLIFGIIGLIGGTVVYQNGQPVYGVAALVTAIVLAFVLPAVIALWLLIGTAILRFLKDRAPVLTAKED